MTATRTEPGVPPPLEDPTDLRRHDIRLALKRTAASFKADDVPNLGAGVAFKMFLSLFPATLAGMAIFSLVVDQRELVELIDGLTDNLPPAASEIVDDTLRSLASTREGAAGTLAIVGVLTGIFSATGAAASLINALNRAYGIGDQRKFVAQRFMGLIIAVALVIALVAIILLIVAGGGVQAFLLPDNLEVPAVTIPLAIARFLLALGVLIALLAFVYWIGPNRERPPWQWLSPGAVLGVLIFLLATLGFRLYTVTAGNYEATYGALAGVIVLLLWLWFTMFAVLIGAELNAELERIRADRAAERLAKLGTEGVSDRELPEDPDTLAQVHRAARDQRGAKQGEQRPQRRSLLLGAVLSLAVVTVLRRVFGGGD